MIRSGTFLRDFHLQGKTFTNYHLVESVRSRTGRGNGPSVRSVTWGLNRERRGSSARKLEHAIAGQQYLLESRSSPEFDAVLEKPRRTANAMHRSRRQRKPSPSIRTRSRPSAIARSGRCMSATSSGCGLAWMKFSNSTGWDGKMLPYAVKTGQPARVSSFIL